MGWKDLFSLVPVFFGTIVIPWFQRQVVTKEDKSRAELITFIAKRTAIAVLAKHPTQSAAELVKLVADTLVASDAVPLTSDTVAYSAAWAAVKEAWAAFRTDEMDGAPPAG